ncbi:MAG: RDD family protein [Acidobacteriota bacterium]
MSSDNRAALYQPPSAIQTESLAGVPLASFMRRASALFIDTVLAGASFGIVSVAGAVLGSKLGLVTADHIDIKFTFFGNWYSVVWLVLYFTLFTYFGHGQTPGKRLCRIRVVSIAHQHLNLWHSFERALGYGASTLEAGFGFFQYFIRKDRRTVHDRIAETIVIDVRRPSQAGSSDAAKRRS